jgi:hypothetical protein
VNGTDLPPIIDGWFRPPFTVFLSSYPKTCEVDTAIFRERARSGDADAALKNALAEIEGDPWRINLFLSENELDAGAKVPLDNSLDEDGGALEIAHLVDGDLALATAFVGTLNIDSVDANHASVHGDGDGEDGAVQFNFNVPICAAGVEADQ